MIDVDGFVAVVLLLFWIWALLDCIATDSALVRNLPKPMWLILVLILPDIGALAWLLLGRPEKAHWRPGSTDYAKPRRPIALEDSPRYSLSPNEVSDRRSEELNRRLDEWERDQRVGGAPEPAARADAVAHRELDAWEQQLDAREAELRRRELEARQRDLDARELQQRERDLDD